MFGEKGQFENSTGISQSQSHPNDSGAGVPPANASRDGCTTIISNLERLNFLNREAANVRQLYLSFPFLKPRSSNNCRRVFLTLGLDYTANNPNFRTGGRRRITLVTHTFPFHSGAIMNQHDVSRRSFLKTSSAGAVSAAALAGMTMAAEETVQGGGQQWENPHRVCRSGRTRLRGARENFVHVGKRRPAHRTRGGVRCV